MFSFLTHSTMLFFTFTTIFTDLVPAAQAAEEQVIATRYSAYVRPKDRPWNRAWTRDLIGAIGKNRRRYELAKDLNEYCPGYASASEAQKNNCFVRLFSGISAWESSNTPAQAGDNNTSWGLLQIGVFNCKKEGYDAAALRVARNNLNCGARLAGDRIAEDGVITSEGPVKGRWGTTRTKRLGLGRAGWTVMMMNRMVPIRGGRMVEAGRLKQIVGGMNGYKDHQTGSVAVLRSQREKFKLS